MIPNLHNPKPEPTPLLSARWLDRPTHRADYHNAPGPDAVSLARCMTPHLPHPCPTHNAVGYAVYESKHRARCMDPAHPAKTHPVAKCLFLTPVPNRVSK